jgi:hypothetical protein
MFTAETIIYCVSATLISAFIIYRVVYGFDAGISTPPTPPAKSPMTCVERAESRRDAAANLVNIVLLLAAMMKIVSHLGWVAVSWKAVLVPVLVIPLLLSIAVYLKAQWDVKRANAAADAGLPA